MDHFTHRRTIVLLGLRKFYVVCSMSLQVKEFYLLLQESISIQRDTLFDASVINPTHLDMFEEYKVTCLNQNNLPVSNPLSQFCRAASFTQSSEFSGGASSCSCHPRGSLSRQCNSIGGKCNCHRNIIGRRCHVCRAGFYNFPNCRSMFISFVVNHSLHPIQ